MSCAGIARDKDGLYHFLGYPPEAVHCAWDIEGLISIGKTFPPPFAAFSSLVGLPHPAT